MEASLLNTLPTQLNTRKAALGGAEGDLLQSCPHRTGALLCAVFTLPPPCSSPVEPDGQQQLHTGIRTQAQTQGCQPGRPRLLCVVHTTSNEAYSN